MDLEQINKHPIYTLLDLSINEVKLLKVLRNGTLSPEAASESNLGEKETMSAASWLRSKGLVKISESSTKFYFTNEEGKGTQSKAYQKGAR